MMTIQQQRVVVSQWLGSGSLNIFGMPWAGKDKQSKLLATWLNAPVVSGGDILRSHDDLPEDVRRDLINGLLAPTDFFLKVVTPYLANPDFADRPLMLSSVGRYHGEEEHIMQAAQQAGHAIRAAILLELDEETVRERWRRHEEQALKDRGHRIEDGEHALDTRLHEFATKTRPVLESYRQRDLLITVEGRQTIPQVEADILAALYERATHALKA